MFKVLYFEAGNLKIQFNMILLFFFLRLNFFSFSAQIKLLLLPDSLLCFSYFPNLNNLIFHRFSSPLWDGFPLPDMATVVLL